MMSDDTRFLRRARWRTARAAAAITAVSGLVILAAACGGPFSGGSGSSPASARRASSPPPGKAQKVLAFSACMRSHGVPDFPDPGSSGTLPKRKIAQLLASNPQFPAAHRACGHLLPDGGQPTQAQVQQAWDDMRKFARCMRSHGVPNWPDPVPTSKQDQRPFFYVPGSIDANSPQIATKMHACQHVFHASNPLVTTQ